MDLSPFHTALSGEGSTEKPQGGYKGRETYCLEDPTPELDKELVPWGEKETPR